MLFKLFNDFIKKTDLAVGDWIEPVYKMKRIKIRITIIDKNCYGNIYIDKLY